MAKKQKNNWKIFKICIVALTIVFAFIALIIIPFNSKVYPNTYVAGIYIGDLTKEQAKEEVKKAKLTEKISVTINDKQNQILTSEIVESIDYDKTVDRAYNYSNSGNLLLDIQSKIKLVFKPINLPLEINYNQKEFSEILNIIAKPIETKPLSPSAKVLNNQVVIEKGRNGTVADIDKAMGEVKQNLSFLKDKNVQIVFIETNEALNDDQANEYRQVAQKFIGSKIELKHEFDTFILSENELLSFIDPTGNPIDNKIITKISDISRKINRNPQNSVFIVENGKVLEFTPSKDGVTVNESALTNNIKDSINQIINNGSKTISFEVAVIKNPAKIKNEDVNNLGINTLLGRGVSYYKGSIPNRVYNIELAQSKFKGILVAPNEVFSFNNVIGDISALTGYKSAYVIKDGKTVLGDGGGVCQVSTTLFRAILNAGLPIIERRAHSYRVGYYEQGFAPGLDATIYYPTTDLKFKNDTQAYLLIQPVIDTKSSSLVFEIYGTSDGRVATVSKPIITSSTAPAADLYVDDPSLPMGTIKQIEYRAYGARVVFDYKVTRNGESLIDQKFVSSYRPWQAVYLRGTGGIN